MDIGQKKENLLQMDADADLHFCRFHHDDGIKYLSETKMEMEQAPEKH